MIPLRVIWSAPLGCPDNRRRQGGHGRRDRLQAGPGGDDADDGFIQPGAQPSERGRPRLAAYKRPRSVRFVPDLPKTSTGKVMRRKLKSLDN